MKYFLTSIALFFSCLVFGQPGTLDMSFGGDGKFTYANLYTTQCQARSVAIQPDGKIILLGSKFSTGSLGVILMRVNVDGTIDLTFGNNGVVVTMITGDDDHAFKVLAQPDGKIVVVGFTQGDSTAYDFALMRFNYNGSVDTSFGNIGIVTTDFANGSTECANTALLQPDGKIVAGGVITQNNQQDFALARYNTDGTLDTLFGNNGLIITNIVPGGNDIISEICLAPGGRILAVGSTYKVELQPVVARYTFTGQLDLPFGPNNSGYYIDGTNTSESFYISVASEPDGRFVVLSLNDVKRYLANGIIDPTFGVNGSFSDFQVYDYVVYTKILTRAGGKYLLAGSKSDWGDFLAVGINENGFIDTLGYGTNGFTSVDFGGNHDYCNDAIFQPDGKLVMVGSADETTTKFAAVRLLGELGVGIIEFALTEAPPLLYPNPLKDIEHLKYSLQNDEQITIVMLDVQGKLISTFVDNVKQNTGDYDIELSMPAELPNSTYFIQIASPKGKVSIKVVK